MSMSIQQEGDTVLVATRQLRAAPEAVFRAHTEADLIRRWMGGHDGWEIGECVCDGRPGGAFRYVLEKGDESFSIEGSFVEMKRPSRILHVERMVMGEASPETQVETRFEPSGSGTRMVMRLTYPDAETRAQALAMGMTDGMADCYDAMDAMEMA